MVRKATQKHGKGHSKRQYASKVVNTKGRRTLDQIQTSFRKNKPLPELDNLPAGGNFTCQKCDVFFRDSNTLKEHFKTKAHKKRVKEFEVKAHTAEDAERAAGLY
jgi:bud site selection protein 20